LGLAIFDNLIKQSILLENVKGSTRVAVNLSYNMREDNAIFFFGLINHFVENAILTNLDSSGLNLTMFLGVGMSGNISEFTSLLSLCGKLLLLLR
jgi:hypothetical protein